MKIFRKQKVSGNEHTTLWKKEAERLKKERNDLLLKLDSIQRYKEDYENLINETKIVKERYEDLITIVEKIFSDYKSKLEKIIESEN